MKKLLLLIILGVFTLGLSSCEYQKDGQKNDHKRFNHKKQCYKNHYKAKRHQRRY
ncbi:MAG: hypothetical protein K1060chlam5_00236 [Candidatus Anoxychlamydiales bacterium]|nr:hypothetical protein [Candidatus Anoxychlamydiales bacterium]